MKAGEPRILIVEDDADINHIVATRLAREGYAWGWLGTCSFQPIFNPSGRTRRLSRRKMG